MGPVGVDPLRLRNGGFFASAGFGSEAGFGRIWQDLAEVIKIVYTLRSRVTSYDTGVDR